MNQDLSRFDAPNSDFYSEIQELTQILLRISEEKFGGWGLWLKYNTMYLPLFYQFKLGTKERDGEFVVHLTLAGDSVNQVM